jgi:hypothetical protein
VWDKRNKQPNNKRDRNDDAIIQTINPARRKENTINLFTQFEITYSGGESTSPFY